MRPRVPQLTRQRALVASGLVVVAFVGLAIVLADPFGATPASSSIDNSSATSVMTVTRRDLSSQTQVSATLGYADPSTIAVATGTAPSAVHQAQQQTDTARASLQSAQASLAADERTLEQQQATLSADQAKQAVDCGGSGAAQSGGGGGANAASAGACPTDAQAVHTDQQAVSSDVQKVQTDMQALGSSRTSVAAAEQSLAVAETSAGSYEQGAVYTELPTVGAVITRGRPLYAIAGQSVLLLYGATSAWRALAPGVSGADVAELNANLTALGFGQLSGDVYTSSTAAAVDQLQSANGLPVTGELLLGSVVFEPRPVRVTTVTPSLGAPVQAGPVMTVTSTRRVVTIALDAASQSNVKLGDAVTITLPDNSTTSGHVSFVGSVATTPSNDNSGGGGGSSSPTIEVDVTPDHPAATGKLDQAPVDVSITTASVANVLAVPVNALLALAGGGYAVEEVLPGGARQLVAVSPGLFDDAQGLVQVSGSGLHVGQRIVVPAA